MYLRKFAWSQLTKQNPGPSSEKEGGVPFKSWIQIPFGENARSTLTRHVLLGWMKTHIAHVLRSGRPSVARASAVATSDFGRERGLRLVWRIFYGGDSLRMLCE